MKPAIVFVLVLATVAFGELQMNPKLLKDDISVAKMDSRNNNGAVAIQPLAGGFFGDMVDKAKEGGKKLIDEAKKTGEKIKKKSKDLIEKAKDRFGKN